MRFWAYEIGPEDVNGVVATPSADRLPAVRFAALLIHSEKRSLFSSAEYINRSAFQSVLSLTDAGMHPSCTQHCSLMIFSSAWGMSSQSIST